MIRVSFYALDAIARDARLNQREVKWRIIAQVVENAVKYTQELCPLTERISKELNSKSQWFLIG